MPQKYGGNDPNKTFYWRSQGLEITRFLHRNLKKINEIGSSGIIIILKRELSSV